jgi:hypothetical protein
MKRSDFINIYNEVFLRVKTLLSKIIFLIFSLITFLSVITIPYFYVFTKKVRPFNEKDISLLNMFSFFNFVIFAFFLIIVFIIYHNTIGNKLEDVTSSLESKSREDLQNELFNTIRALKKYLMLFLILLFFPAFISYTVTLMHVIGSLVYSHLIYYINIVPCIVFILYTIIFLPTNSNIKRLFIKHIDD